jgi:hypothetical protein
MRASHGTPREVLDEGARFVRNELQRDSRILTGELFDERRGERHHELVSHRYRAGRVHRLAVILQQLLELAQSRAQCVDQLRSATGENHLVTASYQELIVQLGAQLAERLARGRARDAELRGRKSRASRTEQDLQRTDSIEGERFHR